MPERKKGEKLWDFVGICEKARKAEGNKEKPAQRKAICISVGKKK